MDYKAPLETYTGRVKEVTLGKGAGALKIGGGNILPLHYFEGSVVNRPLVALEVNDNGAAGWAQWVVEPYKDVVSDPVKWAQKCLGLGADLICLHLDGTDPQGANRPAAEAAALAKKVSSKVNVPLIVYGCGDDKKDVEVLTAVAVACKGENLLLGPAVKENYEALARAVAENGHCIIAQTPIDLNLERLFVHWMADPKHMTPPPAGYLLSRARDVVEVTSSAEASGRGKMRDPERYVGSSS